MDLGLKGRVCVVTGASRGIGREVSRLLCAEGAQVLLVARGEAELAAAAEECGRKGAAAHGRATPFAQDVREPEAAPRIAGEARDRFGREVDVLVNNAGIAAWRPLDEVPDEDWQVQWELSVMAPMRLIREVEGGMRSSGWGRIVNVSSSAGKRPSQNLPDYSVAKAAQLSLSRLFADRLARDGVLVNAVCPGPTKSEMWMAEGGLLDQSGERAGRDREEALAAAGGARPAGRLAEVAEVAAVIVWLCSEPASYVAGSAWGVDGGSVPVIL